MNEYKVLEQYSGERIDKYLAKITNTPRTHIKKAIESEDIKVNNNLIKANYKIQENDVITAKIVNDKEDTTIVPTKMELDIVYEDEYLIVINKQNGVVIHPAPGHYDDTLVNGLLYYSKKLSTINGDFRPGIVHRIDRYTTGLLVIAKTNEVHNLLATAIKNRDISREYLAIVHGNISEQKGIIKAPIGRDENDRKKMIVTDKNSKYAETHFEVLNRSKEFTLVKCKLLTGRTHQIRVHFKYIGHPILGDPEYGLKRDETRYGQYLHAYKLRFNHPIELEKLNFEVNVPEPFEKKLIELGLN